MCWVRRHFTSVARRRPSLRDGHICKLIPSGTLAGTDWPEKYGIGGHLSRQGASAARRSLTPPIHSLDDAVFQVGGPIQEQDSSDVSETYITQLNDAYEFYGFAWEEKCPQSLVILDAVYTETEQEEPSRELSSTTGKT